MEDSIDKYRKAVEKKISSELARHLFVIAEGVIQTIREDNGSSKDIRSWAYNRLRGANLPLDVDFRYCLGVVIGFASKLYKKTGLRDSQDIDVADNGDVRDTRRKVTDIWILSASRDVQVVIAAEIKRGVDPEALVDIGY